MCDVLQKFSTYNFSEVYKKHFPFGFYYSFWCDINEGHEGVL